MYVEYIFQVISKLLFLWREGYLVGEVKYFILRWLHDWGAPECFKNPLVPVTSPMVNLNWEPWRLRSHHQSCYLLWKHPKSHPQGQKTQEDESEHYTIKHWPVLHLQLLWPYLPVATSISSATNELPISVDHLFLPFVQEAKPWGLTFKEVPVV